jgi:replicative DNA helicase
MAVTKSNDKPEFNYLKYGKLPPQAPELEVAVLGALMLEQSKTDDVVDIIPDGECFYVDAHQRIYNAILRLYRGSRSTDFMSVCDELKRNQELELVGSYYFVTGLTKDVVSSAAIEEHARIVMETFTKRELIRNCSEIINDAYEDGADAFDLLDKASNFGSNLLDKIITKQFEHISKPMGELVMNTLNLSIQDDKLTGVESGFTEFDRIKKGFKKGNLIIVAARPSVGKTAFALNLAVNAVISQRKPTAVGIFSLEMDREELSQRMLSNISNIPLEDIVGANLTEQEKQHLVNVNDQIARMPIYIDDSPNLNSLNLKAKAKKMVNKHNVGLIIIDYLQLMTGDSNKSFNREQEISKISRELKILAKTLKVPIIALSQMSRNVEGRSDNIPKLSDLRESGAIEQDADDVYFLYDNSKEELKKNPYRVNERHLKIAKHRGGKKADLTFEFNGAYQRFEKERLKSMDAEFTTVSDTYISTPNKVHVVSGDRFKVIQHSIEPTIEIPNDINELPF